MRKISQGAEAIIYLDGKDIIKHRISKKYRHKELDKKIIKRRTKAEEKILLKISEFLDAPTPKKQKDPTKIVMPFIDGKKLSDHLDNFPEKKQKEIMKKIGEGVSKLHQKNIVHGDLTTSNMIYKKGKVYFIDFGLGFQNAKYEDKGVDIHLLKQALEAKHFKNWETLYKEFEKAYQKLEPFEAEKVLKRLKAIEKRGRYRH